MGNLYRIKTNDNLRQFLLDFRKIFVVTKKVYGVAFEEFNGD